MSAEQPQQVEARRRAPRLGPLSRRPVRRQPRHAGMAEREPRRGRTPRPRAARPAGDARPHVTQAVSRRAVHRLSDAGLRKRAMSTSSRYAPGAHELPAPQPLAHEARAARRSAIARRVVGEHARASLAQPCAPRPRRAASRAARRPRRGRARTRPTDMPTQGRAPSRGAGRVADRGCRPAARRASATSSSERGSAAASAMRRLQHARPRLAGEHHEQSGR